MFVIIGIIVVIGAIVDDYLIEHGNSKVLIQPAELFIISGAAVGTAVISNPLHILEARGRGTSHIGPSVEIRHRIARAGFRISYQGEAATLTCKGAVAASAGSPESSLHRNQFSMQFI